jgi:hypothetical protein
VVARNHQVSSMILSADLPDTGGIGVSGTVDAATSAVPPYWEFPGVLGVPVGTLISSMTGQVPRVACSVRPLTPVDVCI